MDSAVAKPVSTGNMLHARRKLVMMRHADSEDSGEGRDHDRPITEAGRAAAKQVCQVLPAWAAAVRVQGY